VRTPDRQPPHPGPFRFIKADPEWGGILIAIGFVVLGLIGLPLARPFLVGVVIVGALIAVVLHFVRK
jgi:hypothetical protein